MPVGSFFNANALSVMHCDFYPFEHFTAVNISSILLLLRKCYSNEMFLQIEQSHGLDTYLNVLINILNIKHKIRLELRTNKGLKMILRFKIEHNLE